MDSDYDRKFEEMKKYIPFLENMITRLESTNSTSSNPRQAQLDKIRSLRDLLSNKKKRMKMENLLKCEQVLINLYAKVEQRDTLSNSKKETDSGFSIDAPTPKEKSDLEAVRNKLKTVAKLQENSQDTLPEILPRSEINDEHTSGTKEPALFQRRPNQPTFTNKDAEDNKTSPLSSNSKRNYTRVLVSPETSSRRWSPSKNPSEKPLFSRRSPRKSPRRSSPAYHKKERKKSKDRQSRKQKDLNITLNVPEESLNSLNTKDILSRIINCSDGDVDIDTLRELRKQILGELQKTGAKDDISDLILKSYKKKKTIKKSTKKEEIEEGELSDSESEAIESIYGSLVVKDPSLAKKSLENETQPRKIQICLVINSDSTPDQKSNEISAQDATDYAEFEMYGDKGDKIILDKNKDIKKSTIADKSEKSTVQITKKNNSDHDSQGTTDKVSTEIVHDAPAETKEVVNNEQKEEKLKDVPDETVSTEDTQFKANFYNPLTETSGTDIKESEVKSNVCAQDTVSVSKSPSVNTAEIETTLENFEKSPEIPLLHERTIEQKPPDSTLSEIDILQALKNEILSEIPVPGNESITPHLHQPKVMKVANAQDNQMLPKKRISIEKYKEKAITSSQSESNISQKDEQVKKPSLKLTDKECERFFNVPKISFDDEDESLGEDGDGDIEANDVYGDLAPKSPDNEDCNSIDSTPPVIIPVDPVKSVPSNYKADIDMRALPLLSPNTNSKTSILYSNTSTGISQAIVRDKTKPDIKADQSQSRHVLTDPRVRRDLNLNVSTQSPNPHAGLQDRTSSQIYAGLASNSSATTIMTPNARIYEMTPTHQSFQVDQPNRKHVYASVSWEHTDSIGDRRSRNDDSREPGWKSKTDESKRFTDSFNSIANPPSTYVSHREDVYRPEVTKTTSFSKSEVVRKEGSMTPMRREGSMTPMRREGSMTPMRREGSMTPLPSFGRSDCPPTPSHPFGKLECPPTPTHSFGRLECPSTPSNPFGRLDCPPTPNHPFGRLDCPPTPNHPFGRLECPPTPSHSFGRLECPPTPSHNFGRIDCPSTPSHPFGRSECPPTPSPAFGRSEAPLPLMSSMFECPNTPTNQFGGTDNPQTPAPVFGRNEITSGMGHTYSKSRSHTNVPFGRTDSAKNQYGRSDYNTSSYIKDPRLNRKSEPENRSQYDERDTNYFKERDRYRSGSYSSQKPYIGSSNYRNSERELSGSRNSRYKYFAPDQSGRHFNKDQERRDRLPNRSLSKDDEGSGAYSRDRWYSSEKRSREEVGSRREYVREKSVGCGSLQDDTRISIRAPCSNKGYSKDVNSLSINASTGRSFTIDTSINATFQKIIDSATEIQGVVDSFDMRRQRAASVGRSLTREPSASRVAEQVPRSNKNDDESKRRAFQRASSVGREVCERKDQRSFQEIKADFKSCRFSENKYFGDNYKRLISDIKVDTNDKEGNEYRDRDHAKSTYSPRRNYRDPRMRKLTNKSDRDSPDSYGHKIGIVYSNDNIVSGSIMTSGYGVKNYKIPKIKRNTEETEKILEKYNPPSKNNEKDKNNRKFKDDDNEKVLSKGKAKTDDLCPEKDKVPVAVKEVHRKKGDEKNRLSYSPEKRITRSSRKNLGEKELDAGVTEQSNKYNKLINDLNSNDDIAIKNTDSDKKETESTLASERSVNLGSEKVRDLQNKELLTKCEEVDTGSLSENLTLKTNASITPEEKTVQEKNKSKSISHVSPMRLKKKRNLDSDLDASFGIDELEMFSDSIASDPVVENITALIADLDNDLNTPKSDPSHFTNEITLENMLENISSPAKDILNEVEEENESLKIKCSNKDSVNEFKASSNLKKECIQEVLIPVIAKDEISLKEPLGNTPTQSDGENIIENKNDVDSTTENDKMGKLNEDRSKLDENLDGRSTPDSTINTEEIALKSTHEDSLPGTNEVTSTECIEPKQISAKDANPGLDSIGSLLSILQDKSKIKELLTMLGDQSSENEKIKKKLEKLSEIVSDDEETCDIPSTNIDQDAQKTVSSENPNITTVEGDFKNKEVLDDELSSRDSSLTNASSSKIDDENSKTSDIEEHTLNTNIDMSIRPKKKAIKKSKQIKKVKAKPKKDNVAMKRITRASVASVVTKPKGKKIPRELMQLQEDIKEMFIRDEVLSATGIRMCRLAKLVDEKITPLKDEPAASDAAPVVVLEKFKDTLDKNADVDKIKKKKVPKNKVKAANDSVLAFITEQHVSLKQKPGPKCKTKNKKDPDPYTFESDSVCDNTTEKCSDDDSSSNTDSENDSLTSSKSFSSTELLSDLKKKTKRKRRGWQAGVIKTKTKKKKDAIKKFDTAPENILPKTSMPDLNCFTDRNYCFRKNLCSYSCRLCSFTGGDIVLHYRNQHPHIEIPLSRMTPEVAEEAINQCVEIDFKAISKVTSEKYVCTFCFKEFPYSKTVLETFFWHIVSMHTGEYKQNCTICVNVNECPFNLDIPPPPKDLKGQLIGFICKKCNFTQISLENLKTHVIVRHNDEQTAVYTINLSVMSKKALSALIRRGEQQHIPLQPIGPPEKSLSDITEKPNEITDSDDNGGVKTRKSARKSNVATAPIQSKITFEGDDNVSELSDLVSESGEASIKMENIDSENADLLSNLEESLTTDVSELDRPTDSEDLSNVAQISAPLTPSSDINNCLHFKINITESGAKEYACCINGDYHFKTTLLISMKKHVQLKHSEKWDGYCYVCKVIVMPQGAHSFTECLQHCLENHIDNISTAEKEISKSAERPESSPVPKSYINVRPLSELITRSDQRTPIQESPALPIIHSVRSLGSEIVETPQLSSTIPAVALANKAEEKTFRYEEHQADVVAKKYYLVMEAMKTTENLVKLFKCSGRYCSYATDSTEEALAHATTHQRIGGIDALNCCYCDFDSAGNAVDLVTHVFKWHGSCNVCCQQCFYRAASTQAVVAHITRVHKVSPVPGMVLRRTTVSTIQTVNVKMLTREEAVSYYVCGHREQGDHCKFRAYTPDKFGEHLHQRHSGAATHPCHFCTVEVATPADLIQHMKEHGIRLYQCTWCINGADNETEMVAHISIKHPNMQPQAYIRMITKKDGKYTRVLPLAFLIKHKFEATEVTPSATKEHPIREAERSIEMEALIGPFMNETTQPAYQTNEDPIENADTIIPTSEISEEIAQSPLDVKPSLNMLNINMPTQVAEASQIAEPLNQTQNGTVSSAVTATAVPSTYVPGPSTAPLSTIQTSGAAVGPVSDLTPTNMELPVVKTEPVDTHNLFTTDVVVLDSDEEDTPPAKSTSVIDVSDDDGATGSKLETPKIIPITHLFTCPHCKQICKNMGGFKKHIYSCVTNINRSFQCPHCPYQAENVDKITVHYVADHTQKSTFACGLCGALLVSENYARKHMRSVHKEGNIVFTREDKSRVVVTVKEPQKEKVVPKRKLSGPKTDPVPAKRRFEPQEIDLLPITPILDQLVYCSRCEFSTKVRLNMVRHLQLHAEQQPVPQTAPVNPVPHLGSNEKHFDKMLNLASSSIINRTPDKSRVEHTPLVTMLIPPEAAARYPKYVSERQRHTCGAKGCSYISVDEAMLRRHWEALHSGSNDFHCVHCPPHQHLDTSKPLTANRILSHLKMHDSTLYSCSVCSYYHFKREALEKHLSEIHKTGRLMVVREEQSTPVSPAPVPSTSAPTMDLKPWQCGLCKFKSMLRPEVIEHCSKFHQSKMQFKCSYCPFRTSAIENVTKHQTNAHAGKPEEVFYYYYREGSIPDESDGTPRWVKQRQKAGPSEPEVKVETSASPVPKTVTPAASMPIAVDLNLVKKEVNEPSVDAPHSIQDLCKRFGQFCEPNGIKYKCPLCSNITEDTRELMQSHLYEELNYRKWSCGLCSYNSFHREGLTDHMTSEHGRQYDHIELPTDVSIEKWVGAVLDHQTTIINKHKENLAKQKIVVDNNKPGPSNKNVVSIESVGKYCDKDLVSAFGPFGSPNCVMFCCPKCGFLCKEEGLMRDHLEMELNKIRWCCSSCPEHFQTYHEAQFHCKSHDVRSRPLEAPRDPALRAAWLSAAILAQKQLIQDTPDAFASTSEPPTSVEQTSENDNSLLVVRYEERVPTPDRVNLKRKRVDLDDDDKKKMERRCRSCDYRSVNPAKLKAHMLSHYGLRAYSCGYCLFDGPTRKGVARHVETAHRDLPVKVITTELPPEGKELPNLQIKNVICLVCERPVPETQTSTHLHDNVRPEFTTGPVAHRCCICSNLYRSVASLSEHHGRAHPGAPLDYELHKLVHESPSSDGRHDYDCVYCGEKFRNVNDHRQHQMTAHPELQLGTQTISPVDVARTRETDTQPRRCARKSTTKLPNSVAKKSTTKLPNTIECSIEEEYSYYGTRPLPLEEYSDVTILMSFCNMMMPFSMKQLSEHLNIEPRVMVTDIKDSNHLND